MIPSSNNKYNQIIEAAMDIGTTVANQFRRQQKEGPSHHHQTPTESRKNPEKHQHFKIPLISKKMNSVQKYISTFDDRQDYHRDDFNGQSSKSKYQDHTANRQLMNHHRSVDVYALHKPSQEEGGNCLKYSPMVNECSEQRLQKLVKLQKDYSLLKQKLNPHRKNYTGDQSMIKSSRRIQKAKPQQITEEEVEKELKNTVVNQNGQKYFADLYLLKKGRESIMNSLSNAGKFALNTNSDSISMSQLLGKMSYEEKLKANEKDFVSGKIMEEREAKRNKMMKGRNLHWNVYYDMLALSASERHKLKGLCKFSSTFGIS